MATSSTEICNFALLHLGQSKRIANLTTEQSKEAGIFRTFYETVRDLVLRDYNWPFATKIADLGLVEENPNDEWAYSYRYPSDALMIRRILSGVRNDARNTKVAYKIGKDAQGLLIFCDLEEAQLEYTEMVSDVSYFPDDFAMALSYRLAYYAAPAITNGDPFQMQGRMMQMYNGEISKATANSFNEEQPDELPDSEFIRFRE